MKPARAGGERGQGPSGLKGHQNARRGPSSPAAAEIAAKLFKLSLRNDTCRTMADSFCFPVVSIVWTQKAGSPFGG